MKFAKVQHERCGEPDGTSYGFVPDEWTQEDFEAAVDRARKAYAADTNAYMEELKAGDLHGLLGYWYPNKNPHYERYPDKTVKEVKELHEAELAEKQRKKAIIDAARKSFNDYLAKEGFTPFWYQDAELETEIMWGHQHGVPLDYKGKEPWDEDKRGAAYVKEDDD